MVSVNLIALEEDIMTLHVRISKKIKNAQNNNLRNEKIIQNFETRRKSIATAQKTKKQGFSFEKCNRV